jgi:hypothetical protein
MGVVGAAVLKVVLGMIWWAPVVFWPAWSKLTGISEAKAKPGMPRAMAVEVVGSLLTSFVLMHAIFYAGARTAPLGMAVGFMNWLGFVAFTQVQAVTYEQRPFKLFQINTGFQLVSLVLMGAVISIWGLNWT